MSVAARRKSPDEIPGLTLPQPYLLFLGAATEAAYAKTAFGLRDWARDKCLGEYALSGCSITLGLPALAPAEAAAKGARSFVIGIANDGGVIAPEWTPSLIEALEAGLDLVSGMHMKLNDHSMLTSVARRLGRQLIDIRTPPTNIPVASGTKRSGKRLLTVGTDCALGKKYSALSIARAFQRRGVDADFRATGQTGIMIAGRGMPMDAIVADFAAGAAEMLSPDAHPGHWDVIEGQGSLFHPSYAGVSLSLLHGSQPDVIVVCHEAGRTHIVGHADYPLPGLEETIAVNLKLGARTNPAIRCAGVTINTSALTAADAEELLEKESRRLGLPVADPVRGGAAFDSLVDKCLG